MAAPKQSGHRGKVPDLSTYTFWVTVETAQAQGPKCDVERSAAGCPWKGKPTFSEAKGERGKEFDVERLSQVHRGKEMQLSEKGRRHSIVKSIYCP